MNKIFLLLVTILFTNLYAQSSEFFSVGTLFYSTRPDTQRFRSPWGIVKHPKGDTFYVTAHGNHQIQKVTGLTGTPVITLAGTVTPGYKDSIGTFAQFNGPANLCIDTLGNLYVSDFNNHRIRKVTPQGVVTTLAGSGIGGYLDGPADSARFHFPRGIALDDSGNVYVADSWNHRIRKISTTGQVTTLCGGGSAMGVGSVGSWVDGQDTSARFYTPAGLFHFKEDACLYLADAYNHRIRKITLSGQVSTVAGNGPSGPSNGGYLDGNLTVGLLNTPTEVCLEKLPADQPKMYISDTYNHSIREVNWMFNTIQTVAGNGTPGFHDAWGNLARFDFPRGIVVTRGEGTFDDNLIICDFNNHVIRGISNFWMSLDETNTAPIVHIWPVPGKDSLHFSEVVTLLDLYDSLGKKILNQEYPDGTVSTSVMGLTAGIYRISGTLASGKSFHQSIILKP